MKKVSVKTQVAVSPQKGTRVKKPPAENEETTNHNKKKVPADESVNTVTFHPVLGPLVDCIDVAVVMVTNDFIVTDANQKFCTLFGYTHHEITNVFSTNIFSNGNPLPLPSGDKKNAIEWAGYHKNGTPITISVTTAQITPGRGASYLLATVQHVIPSAGNEEAAHATNAEMQKSSIRFSDNKKMGSHVAHSNDRFRALVDNGHEGVVIFSADGTIMYVSAVVSSVFGYTEKEAFKKNPLALVHPDDVSKLEKHWEKVLANEGIIIRDFLCRLQRKDGEWRWIESNFNNMLQNYSVQGIVVNFRDVTGRVEALEKIRQSEENLTAIFENTDEGFVLINPDDTVKACNDIARYSVFTGSEMHTGDNIFNFVEEHRKEFFKNILLKAMAGESSNYDLPTANKQTGKPLWVNINVRPVKNDNEVVAACITGRDITLQKAEEQQKERIKKLLNSAENIAKIGSAEIDLQTGKRIWSDEFYRILGLEPGSMEPSREGIMQFLHPDDKDIYVQWLQHGLANKVESQQIETRLITVGGEVRNVMAYGSTKYNDKGIPDILIGVIQDITDRKKMERDLKESREMYQSLFHQNPSAVFAMNMDGYLTSVNKVMAIKAESTEEALLTMHFSDFIFPEDLPAVTAYFEDTKTGITQEHEIKILTAKGNTLHVSMVSLPIIVGNEITGVYCIATDITPQKKSLQLLNKTLADRQRILDYSFDLICEIDAEGKFLQISNACEKILGYTATELIGKKFIDFVLEEDKQRTLQAADQLVSSRVPVFDFENRYVKKDGNIVNLFWSVRWDKNEKTMYGIARDATEKKEQEQALGLSEQRYHHLFNSNPLPLYIFDFTTHRIIEANRSALNKYGYTKEEFLSLTIDALRPASEMLIMNKMLQNEQTFSQVKERIWTHKKKNGELMYVKSNGNIVHYNGRKCVLSILDDVTSKIKSEDAIRESEEKRRLIMNAALDAIVCMDLKGNITFWNPKAEKIFGWKEAEAMGHSIDSLIIPERYRRQHHKGMDKYLKTGDGPALNKMLSLYAISKDHREFPIEMMVQSIKQKDEEFFCSFIRDVTEQRKADSLKNFERRDKEALINSTDDLIWSVTKDLKLIAGNRAFIKNYISATGVALKPGDYLLKKDVFSEDMLLVWHEMYYYALSGETIKKEILSSNPTSGLAEWNEVSFNPIYNGKEITGVACYSRNITENKLQQDKLLAINKKLETAQQMASLGYWEIDLKTNAAYWSDELFRIHGFAKTNQPVSLQQIAEVIHPDDIKNVTELYTEALAGKKAYDFEHRIILNDGSIKVLLQKGSLVYNKAGDAVALEGTTQDITLLKQAEKAVKDSEEKYRMIFNCNPLPNWIYDLQTLQIMEVNDAAIAHYGYTGCEFLRMTIKELFAPGEIAAFEKANSAINNYGIVNFGQWQHLTKSGVALEVDITGHSIFYNNRNAVMITSNDITGIIQSRQALIKSIERFEYATKATSDAIWDCDLVNNDVFWGEGFNTLFGYKMKDALPGLQSWENYIHPDEKDAMVRSINTVIEDKNKNYWQGEYRFRKFDGSYTNVSDCALVIRDANGTPYRIIGAIQDISKRIQNEIILKELNEQLNIRAAELASSNAELEQFAYIASHDLQEPLRMVTSFLNQIQKKYDSKLDETGRVYIGFAVDGAVRMRKIIQDLLEYSRVGWQKYHFEKINIGDLLTEVNNMYSGSVSEKNIIISWTDMPEITAAKVPLQQLFQNLIGNAIKYQRPDSIPEITITAAAFNNHWQFAVSDNGIGIEPEYFERIFVIFQRLHNKNEFSGTGIGLAICKKIVDNHNGKIWVKSEPSKGSTFYFTIARQPSEAAAILNEPAPGG